MASSKFIPAAIDVTRKLPIALAFRTPHGNSVSIIVGTRVIVDFEIMANDAAYHNLLEATFSTAHRPLALWRPLPPAVAGIYRAFRMAKVGRRVEKWFSHNEFKATLATAHYYLVAAVAIYGSRLVGNPLPFPESFPWSGFLGFCSGCVKRRTKAERA